MAMLGKTVCYINSSCVALMRWVKTLEHKIKKKEAINKVDFVNCCFAKLCGKGHSDTKQQFSKSKENYCIKLKSAVSRQFLKAVGKKPKILLLMLYTHSEKMKGKNPLSKLENTCYHASLKPCKT